MRCDAQICVWRLTIRIRTVDVNRFRTLRYGVPADRLTPDDWTAAAVVAIASGGARNVSVERIARELGATKGSFYWHFADRTALLQAALLRWELDYTDTVIERLAAIDDPRRRLRTLIEISFADHPGVRVDANLLADADDPMIGATLARVTAKRLAAIETMFVQMGATAVKDRALLTFNAYVGLSQLRRTAPRLAPGPKRARRYIDLLMDVLTA
jgi:AcrR family transcriptional regulator